jgi:BlaI family penicillinase repressor
MSKARPVLTPQELAIMKVVWRLRSVTVREVYEALREDRAVAYTTVMTMMNILEEKGHLRRVKRTSARAKDGRAERAYEYRPTRGRQQVVAALVREFVNRVFDGAAEPLMLHLARTERLSEAQRRELRRLIEDAEPRKERL